MASSKPPAGRPTRPRAAFESGLEIVGDLDLPLLHARLSHAYGAFLRRHGHPHDAAAPLLRAAELLDGLRAEPLLQVVERELAACGRHRARRGAAHLSLTRHELAVAQLVADGRSNRDVADALVISVKTVEYHLTNVYAELGVTSRTQMAAQLRSDDPGARSDR